MVNIYIQGQLLDQYSDEAIEITSSVLDVGDLTKNTGDFSKTFTIPASPNNNKHFKHWYNAAIDNGFDSRTKVDGHIDIDGVPFKTGKWRLSEATFKDGEVDSYIINFFGNLPNIKDTIGDDLLSDLNFVHNDHDWSGSVVREGLESGLTSSTGQQKEVIYTPIAPKRYFFDSNPVKSPDIGDNINIAATGGGTGIVWRDLRPSLKAKTIIKAIEHKYGAGTRQSVSMFITQTPSVSGLTKITLNGEVINIGAVAGMSATDLAVFMSSYINTLGGYSSTSYGAIVNILSDTMQPELTPQFDPYEATDMEANIRVIDVGAYPYENPIIFSNDFFNTSEFEQMYLWLKRDNDTNIGGATEMVNWATGNQTNVDFDTNEVRFNMVSGQTMILNFVMSDVVGYENIPYSVVMEAVRTFPNGKTDTFDWQWDAVEDASGNISNVQQAQSFSCPFGVSSVDWTVRYYIKTNTEFRFTANLIQTRVVGGVFGAPLITGAPENLNSQPSRVVVSDMMPDIKIVDFLKGLFDMFKLVIIPRDDGSMYVNTLDSFYSQGNRYDITDKVDRKSFKVKRGELYQSIGFKFEDPSTILNKEFKNKSKDNQSYGSTLVNIYERERPIKLIDGEKVDIKLPFEQLVYERLTDTFTLESTTLSIASIIDDKLAPVTPKPILHYVSKQAVSGNKVKFVSDNNVIQTLNNSIFMPMNQFGTIEPMYSLLFEAEFSCWNGEALTNNLYSIHHKDYLLSVFELKRRSFEYDALLPTQLVTRLGLNDILTIAGIDYRINKFKHNLLTGITKLDLINGFDTTLNEGVYIPSIVRASAYGDTLYFNVPKANTGYAMTKIDTGQGTSWATIGVFGQDDNIMLIRCNSDNSTTIPRELVIRYTNLETGVETNITLIQNAK